jgi:hypothetical protein
MKGLNSSVPVLVPEKKAEKRARFVGQGEDCPLFVYLVKPLYFFGCMAGQHYFSREERGDEGDDADIPRICAEQTLSLQLIFLQ